MSWSHDMYSRSLAVRASTALLVSLGTKTSSLLDCVAGPDRYPPDASPGNVRRSTKPPARRSTGRARGPAGRCPRMRSALRISCGYRHFRAAAADAGPRCGAGGVASSFRQRAPGPDRYPERPGGRRRDAGPAWRIYFNSLMCMGYFVSSSCLPSLPVTRGFAKCLPAPVGWRPKSRQEVGTHEQETTGSRRVRRTGPADGRSVAGAFPRGAGRARARDG